VTGRANVRQHHERRAVRTARALDGRELERNDESRGVRGGDTETVRLVGRARKLIRVGTIKNPDGYEGSRRLGAPQVGAGQQRFKLVSIPGSDDTIDFFISDPLQGRTNKIAALDPAPSSRPPVGGRKYVTDRSVEACYCSR